MVVLIGTTGTSQTIAEKKSVSIKTNFKESLDVTAQSELCGVKNQVIDSSSIEVLQPKNSIFRITSGFEQSNAKVLCAEKVCAFIYFKNNLLNTLSNEVMCLV